MFGIGVPELILILIIGLVIFGPGKLPEVGKAIGRSLNEFKKATSASDNDNSQTKIVKSETKTEPEKIEPPQQKEK